MFVCFHIFSGLRVLLFVCLLPHFQWAEGPTVCLFVSTFSVGLGSDCLFVCIHIFSGLRVLLFVCLLPHFQWAEGPTVCFFFVSTFSVG